jgi:hypothetical protein
MRRQAKFRKHVELKGFRIPDAKTVYALGLVFFGPAAVVLVIIFYMILSHALNALIEGLPPVMPLVAQGYGALIAAVCVLVTGCILFALKFKYLFLFACVEIGAALALTVEACERLAPSRELAPFAATLFPVIYLAVTGAENFHKAHTRQRSG